MRDNARSPQLFHTPYFQTRLASLLTWGVRYAALVGLFALALFTNATAANFSGSLTGVTITDAQATNKPPVAAFTYTISGNTVAFDASGSTDPDGTISQYKWDFGDGTTGTGVQTQHTYGKQTTTIVTLTLVDNNNGIALYEKPLAFPISVNFQPANVPIPSGFVVDSGAVFSTTTGYGWTSPPLSLGTRDRDSSLSPDQSYDTFIHVDPTGVWEITLPNGTYSVTVCVGDPTYPDSSNTVQAENVIIVDHQIINTTTRWITKTADVSVADGRLTLKFTGSSPYTKLCWVKIVLK